jgi:hypothetical protein
LRLITVSQNNNNHTLPFFGAAASDAGAGAEYAADAVVAVVATGAGFGLAAAEPMLSACFLPFDAQPPIECGF